MTNSVSQSQAGQDEYETNFFVLEGKECQETYAYESGN